MDRHPRLLPLPNHGSIWEGSIPTFLRSPIRLLVPGGEKEGYGVGILPNGACHRMLLQGSPPQRGEYWRFVPRNSLPAPTALRGGYVNRPENLFWEV